MTRKTVKKVIPNRVFIGCPWRIVRAKYERAVEKLKKKYPLFFVIVGRGEVQDAQDLLSLIKDNILSSSYAVFDATGGNANVSLEYGFAEASSIQCALYLSVHGASKLKSSSDAPIIADLAGQRRNQYKQENELHKLLAALARQHPYTKRFEKFMKASFKRATKGKKKSARALALKVIHALDGYAGRRRADLVQELLAGTVRYTETEVTDMIKRLHKAGLITVTKGRQSSVEVS